MDLELMIWGDSTVRLAFWDSMHGKDQIFILFPDGKVLVSTYEDNETEALQEVDLVAALIEMAQREE